MYLGVAVLRAGVVVVIVLTSFAIDSFANQCQPPDLNIVVAPSLTIMYTMKILNMMRCQRACAYPLGCQQVAYNTTMKICHFMGNGRREIPTSSVLEYADKTILDQSHPCASHPCAVNSICFPSYVGDTTYHCIPIHRKDCKELLTDGFRKDGVYNISFDNNDDTTVVCDMTSDGGGWNVFHQGTDGSVNFANNWAQYVNGFGQVKIGGNYWLGLERIYQLTINMDTELYVKVRSPTGVEKHAKYSLFNLEDATDNYAIHVSGHSGTAVDAMAFQNMKEFSTDDKERTRM